MLTEKVFTEAEVPIHYLEGPVNGPPLVVLHGLADSTNHFRDLLLELAPTWHVHACTLRGHEKSGRATGSAYRLVDYLPDITAFLRSLAGPAVLIGHSLGAMIALGAAAAQPARVRALELLDVPLYLRDHTVLEDYPARKKSFEMLYMLAEANAACGDDSIALEAIQVVLQSRMLDGFDLEQELSKVQCPTLLIHGEWQNGSVVRDEDAAWFQGKIPQAVVRQIPNSGHQLLWEQKEIAYQYLTHFLENI
jgi:pimeloyl-ACP methyl ester carboxylesterase